MEADLPPEAMQYLLARELNRPAVVWQMPEGYLKRPSLDRVLVVAMGDKEKDEAVSGDNPNDLEKRIKELQSKITKYPKNPDLYYQLSNLYEENKQYDNSLESFKKAVDNGLKGVGGSNGNVEAQNYFKSAETLRRAKKYEEAIKEYEKALTLDSNNGRYYEQLAYTLRELGKIEEAIKTAKKGTQVDPTSLDCLSELEFEYRQKGEYYSSILASEKILCIGPKGNISMGMVQTSHYAIAFSLKGLGKYKEAIEHLNELAKYEKEDEYTIKLRKECIEELNKSK